MDQKFLLVMIMIGGLLLLLAVAVRGEMECLLSFLMRGLLGAMGIHLMNFFLASQGIFLGVGINFLTFLTTGFLGIPGFLGLYALGFYKLL